MEQKVPLDYGFQKYTEALLDLDELQGMFSGNIDCIILEGNGGKGSTKLVCLRRM
jgi:hypothetical protein